DWKNDEFVTHLWLVSANGGDTRQLTRGEKSVSQVRWSPDGQWIAFVSSRSENKPQVFALRPDGGEAIQLTKSEAGVQRFAWSNDGRQLAYIAAEAPSAIAKNRKSMMSEYTVVRR